METTISIESWETTSSRWLSLAEKMDRKEHIKPSRRIVFDSFAALMEQVTPVRQALLAAVRKHPSSLAELAVALKRDPGEVKRDVQAMREVGLLRIRRADLGHGSVKVVTAPKKIRVRATL